MGVNTSTRLSMRYLDDDILLSDTHAWTYVHIPLAAYEFKSAEYREDLAVRMSVALAQLVTNNQSPVDVHLLVTHRPLNVDRWESDLAERVSGQGPTSGWTSYLSRMGDRLDAIGFHMKEVYLGVCLGPRQGKGSVKKGRDSAVTVASMMKPVLQLVGLAQRAVGLEDDVASVREIDEWHKRADDVRRTLAGGALHAVPAKAEQVAWLVAKPLWPAPLVQPPVTASTARTWGPGALQQLVEGVVTNHYRWLEIEQVGEAGMETAFSATLAVSRFPDVLHFPAQEPWMHFAESLLVPASADWSTRMSIVPPMKVQKDVGRKLADAKDQAQHIAETGTSVPLKVREQLEVATVLEYTIDKDRTPWAYARHRITVTGTSAEEVTARAKTVIERYRELNIDVVWPSGDQFGLMLEQMPGDRPRTQAYFQRQELNLVSGGMPIASSDCGDKIELGRDRQQGWLGPYIGATNSRVLQPVFFSPHVAMTRNNPPGVAITGAPGGGKALALDTPIPTPAGWTVMGDLVAGDVVFDEAGRPCHVLYATEVMSGHDCFEVMFDDGSSMVADADHRWVTSAPQPASPGADAADRADGQGSEAGFQDGEWDALRVALADMDPDWHATAAALCRLVPGGPGLRAYTDAAGRLAARGERPVLMPAGGRMVRMWPARSLAAATLEPVLGAVPAQVRTTREIAASLRTADGRGYAHAVPVAGALSLPDVDLPADPFQVGWVLAGGIGTGEQTDAGWGQANMVVQAAGGRIPAGFLRAGDRQRRALLQGLYEGGTGMMQGSGPSGPVSVQVPGPAAGDVADLVHSVGGVLYRRTDRDAGWDAGRVSFLLPGMPGMPADRVIVAVRPVTSVPVRCITVDAPSHLYLAGREMIPTHNSFLAFTLAYQMAVQGVWTIYIDPKADAKPMGSLPGLGRPRVFDLRDGNDGMLDPFSLGTSKSESTLLALETMRLLLGGNVSEEREEALLNAVEVVSQSPSPSLSGVVDVLLANAASSGARNLGAVLKTIRELPFARLCFAATGGVSLRPEDGLTVVTLLGLDLPNASTGVDDYSYENRLAVSVMYLLTRYARQLMLSMDKSHPKAICIDEAWAITSTPQGAKLIPEIARMGRSHNTALVLVSQNASDLMEESVTNSLSTKFAFRSTIPAEVDSVMDLFGLAKDQGFQASVRNLGNGQCLMQDVDGRVAAIQIDNWDKKLMETFDTNPETRGKKVIT
jgi:hypothetical protein